jgi:type VI secretion system VasD/TssJ family lipoprotein
MRTQRIASEGVLWLLAGAALVALPGCAKRHLLVGPAPVHVVFTATSDLNSGNRVRGFRLNYRILQLAEVPSLEGVQIAAFWGREKELLKTSVLGTPAEGFLMPGAKKEESIPREPKARAVLVEGDFYRPKGSCWFHVHPLDHGSTIRLGADASCLAPAPK